MMQNEISATSAPKRSPNATNSAALTDSMINGATPIGPQRRHLPCRASQLTSGTRSGGPRRAPHEPHALGGRTTDLPSGTRSTTTVRNEPTSTPDTAQAITTSVVSISSAR